MTINFRTKVRGSRVYHKGSAVQPKPLSDLSNIANLKSFESDRGRILNSAAIRRLQQKTQVFPLERNAAVRSRLTHSLEVQQVGRYITQQIFEKLGKQNKLHTYGMEGLDRQFESIVEMSCLMHDVGNPPFGHFGERAINDWFKNNIESLVTDTDGETRLILPVPMRQDLTSFEGNAQAIRLVHTLLALNLTYSQVSGIFKYTRRGDEKRAKESLEGFSYLTKKVGYYLSEYRFVASMKTVLGMDDYCRSPFAYIMEAADDICYGLADLEDAVEKGILSVNQLKCALVKTYKNLTIKSGYQKSDKMKEVIRNASKRAAKVTNGSDSHFFVYLRVAINDLLPDHAANQFINNIGDVYEGKFNRALIENFSENHLLIETFKSVAGQFAFCDPEVERSELQGYRIITGLLDIYKPLLMLNRAKFESLADDKSPLYEYRIYKNLPQKHLRAYQNAINTLASADDSQEAIAFLPFQDYDEDQWEFYFRVRLIQDYISGMTDQFAYDEYRSLNVVD